MDDFTLTSLQESKNEWCARLVNILTPLIVEGFNSIYTEAFTLCERNEEVGKYLMTFQNFIARVPKWNANIIKDECNRIIERSGCNYLEDLISCVHIIQLKVLTCMRVGQQQKKIDINIPKLDDFIHKCYINCARKIYSNVYLYEKDIPPLLKQKNNRELEIIIQDCILVTIRDSLPIESIIKNYMDESVEEVITEEVKEEKVVVPEENKSLEKNEDIISEENNTTIKDNVEENLQESQEIQETQETNSNDLDISKPLIKINTEEQNNLNLGISEDLDTSDVSDAIEKPHISFNSENIVLDGNDETHTEDINDGLIKIEDSNVDLNVLDIHDISKDMKLNEDIHLDYEEL
jgi:hypothetical protein